MTLHHNDVIMMLEERGAEMRKVMTKEAFEKVGDLRVAKWLATNNGQVEVAEKLEEERQAIFANPDSYVKEV